MTSNIQSKIFSFPFGFLPGDTHSHVLLIYRGVAIKEKSERTEKEMKREKEKGGGRDRDRARQTYFNGR